MRLRTALSLTTLFLLLFTVAAWSLPLSSEFPATASNGTPDTQSLVGKITAIGDAEFSVTKNEKTKPVRFLVDGNTTVEGRLVVGAQASVEYRSEDGNNIAMRVVVKPESK